MLATSVLERTLPARQFMPPTEKISVARHFSCNSGDYLSFRAAFFAMRYSQFGRSCKNEVVGESPAGTFAPNGILKFQ